MVVSVGCGAEEAEVDVKDTEKKCEHNDGRKRLPGGKGVEHCMKLSPTVL